MPTLNCILYLLAIGLALLFRFSYLGWFGPYLAASVIGVPLLLIILSLPSMLRMKLRFRAPSRVMKGGEAGLSLLFQGGRLLPLSRVCVWVEVENRFAGEVYKQRYVYRNLSAGEAHIPLPTQLCGVLCCRVARCECRDLLGLIALRRKCPAPVFCTVMPPAVPPEQTVDLEAALNTAAVLKPKYGGGYSEEHELREYRPGDTVNSIHWKLSSKTDAVIVREPLVQENQTIYLVLTRVGVEDRGLEVLYWLSLELCRMELRHIIVSNALYPVGNESEAAEALTGILSAPIAEPCSFDAAQARRVFRISAGEVKVS